MCPHAGGTPNDTVCLDLETTRVCHIHAVYALHSVRRGCCCHDLLLALLLVMFLVSLDNQQSPRDTIRL